MWNTIRARLDSAIEKCDSRHKRDRRGEETYLLDDGLRKGLPHGEFERFCIGGARAYVRLQIRAFGTEGKNYKGKVKMEMKGGADTKITTKSV